MLLFLFFLYLFQRVRAQCNTTLCFECPSTQYRKEIFFDTPLNIDSCLLKAYNSTYKKTIYVSSVSSSPSFSDGSFTFPYVSLLSAFINLHSKDEIQKYKEQEIEIILIGSPHYIKYSDLLFSDMVFFSGLNATITILPFFCEVQNISGCVNRSKNEMIDVIVKTDRFSLIVFKELNILNIRILGNDVVLRENSSLSCFNENKICCTDDNFTKDGECYLLNKLIKTSSLSQMLKVKSLFLLRNFIDDDYKTVPKINLTNFIVQSTNIVKTETFWLSFIFSSPLSSTIVLMNFKIINSFFPMGFYYCLSLSMDPYYKSINNIVQKSDMETKMSLENFFLERYNTYKIVYSPELSISLFSYVSQPQVINVTIKELLVTNITLDFSPKNLFNIMLSMARLSENSIFVQMDGINVINCTGVSLLRVGGGFGGVVKRMRVENILNSNSFFPIIYSENRTNISLYDCQFKNITVNGNGIVNFYNSTGYFYNFSVGSNQMVGNFSKSRIIFENCVLYAIALVGTSTKIIYLENTNFTMSQMNIAGVQSYYFIYMIFDSGIYSIKIIDSICNTTQHYYFAYIDSLSTSFSIVFKNYELTKMKSYTGYNYYYLIFIKGGNINSFYIDNLYIHDGANLLLLNLKQASFQTVSINNLNIQNIATIKDHLLSIMAIDSPFLYNGSLSLQILNVSNCSLSGYNLFYLNSSYSKVNYSFNNVSLSKLEAFAFIQVFSKNNESEIKLKDFYGINIGLTTKSIFYLYSSISSYAAIKNINFFNITIIQVYNFILLHTGYYAFIQEISFFNVTVRNVTNSKNTLIYIDPYLISKLSASLLNLIISDFTYASPIYAILEIYNNKPCAISLEMKSILIFNIKASKFISIYYNNPSLTIKMDSVQMYNLNIQLTTYFDFIFFQKGEINTISLKNIFVHDIPIPILFDFYFLSNISSIRIENLHFYNIPIAKYAFVYFDMLASAQFREFSISSSSISNYSSNNTIFYFKYSPANLSVNDLILFKLDIDSLIYYYPSSLYSPTLPNIQISNVSYLEINLFSKRNSFLLYVLGGRLEKLTITNIIIKKVFNNRFLYLKNFMVGKISNVFIQENFNLSYYLILFDNEDNYYYPSTVEFENISYKKSNYSIISLCYFGYMRMLTLRNVQFEQVEFYLGENIFYCHFMFSSLNFVILDTMVFVDNNFMMNSPLFRSSSTDSFTLKNCLIEASTTDPFKRFQVLSLSYFSEVNIINNTIIGMASLLTPKKPNDDYGIFALINKNYNNMSMNRSALIQGNFFENNMAYQRSLICSAGTEFIMFIDNRFFNNSAMYGCGYFISYRFLVVRNMIAEFMESNYGGGGLFLQSSLYTASINDSFFYNMKTNGEGSCFYLTNINAIKLFNLSTTNTSSSLSGGVFYLSSILLASFYLLSLSSSYSPFGGVFYLVSSTLLINESLIKDSFASDLGGVGHFFGRLKEDGVLIAKNMIILRCFCEGDGGALSLGKMREIVLERMVVEGGRVGGRGLLFGEGEEGEKEEGWVEVREGIFSNNFAEFGANFYYYSNDYLLVDNLISDGNVGNLLNIISNEGTEFRFENYSVYQNNRGFDEFGSKFTKPFFKFFECKIEFRNVLMLKNYANSMVFDIFTSEVRLYESKFKGISFNEMYSKQTGFKFFHLSNSILYSSYNEFDFSLELQSKIYEVTKSQFFSFSDIFKNIVIKTDSSIIYAENSELSIKASYFLNLSASNSVIWAKNSDLNINDSNFNTNNSVSPDINFECGNSFNKSFIISSSSFKTRNPNSISIIRANLVIIYDSYFSALINQESIKLSNINRAIYLYNISAADISNTIFENFKYIKGACITALKPDIEQPLMRIEIAGCIFSDNIGNFGSVIYIFGSIILTINKAEFKSNKAVRIPLLMIESEDNVGSNFGKGGVIMIDCEYFVFCSFEIANCLFLNNYAEELAPTILTKLYEGHSIESKECFFYNNSDQSNFSSKMVSSPIRTFLLDQRFSQNGSMLPSQHYYLSTTVLNDFFNQYGFTSNLEIVSGQNFNFSLLLTDFFNQLIINDYESKAELSCLEFDKGSSTWEKSFILNYGSKSRKGVILFENIKIISLPGSSLKCEIAIYYNDYLLFQSSKTRFSKPLNTELSLKLQLNLRKCIRGEIYMMDKSCFKCNQGTYLLEENPMSLNASKKCISCPENAFCYGGDGISPLKGYWRNSSNSTLILKCPTEEGCQGVGANLALIRVLNFEEISEEAKIKGECHPNYSGALCYNCKKGLARLKANSICRNCDELYVIYLKMAFSIIFLVGYVIMQAKIFSNVEKKDANFAILMKILLNHLQTISLINLIDLGWTVEFDIYFSLQDYLSFLTEDFFVIDCLVQSINENLLVQKVIFTILIPLILSLIMIFIWILAFTILYNWNQSAINQKLYSYLQNKMRITFLIFIFILYSEIVRKSFSLLNCTSIDNTTNKTVLQLSPDIECWNSTHKFWVFTVSLPGLIVWGVLAPSFILLVLRKHKKKIYEYLTLTKIKKKPLFNHTFISNYKIKYFVRKVSIYMDNGLAKHMFEGKTLNTVSIGYEKKRLQCLEYTEYHILERREIEREIIKNKIKREKKPPVNMTFDKLNFFESYSLITEVDDFKSYFQTDDVPMKEISQYDFEQYLSFKKIVYQQVNFDLKSSRNKKKLQSTITRMQPKIIKKSEIPKSFLLLIKNLGFLYRGYRKEAYYWELVIFTRKFILIFIGVFTEFFPKQIKPTMLLIILITYICLQTHYQPFQRIYLNTLETMSLITAFSTACVGILLFSNHMKQVSVLFVFLVFAINLMFLFTWIKNVFIDGNLYSKVKAFAKEMIMKKKKFKSNFSETKNIIYE